MSTTPHMDLPRRSASVTTSDFRQLPRLLISHEWRWMTLGIIIMALVMVRLGIWQLDRLDQRRQHNQLLSNQLTAAPLVLRGQPLNPADLQYRRVTLAGTYDVAHEIVLRNRSRDQMPGMDVVTPLHIAGTDQTVLVDRGFVPFTLATPAARKQFAVTSPVSITGVIRQTQTRLSSLTPLDQQPAGGRLDAWFRVDIARIQNQVPYPLLPYFVEQLPAPGVADLPHPQPRLDATDQGPHLGYALQWFAFSVTLLGCYGTFVVKRAKAAHQSEQAGIV